jgi:predicted nucleic acid-binding protein
LRRYYRRRRGLGVTLRGTPDLFIAIRCIAHAMPLLHRGRDYAAMAECLALSIQPV